MARIQDGDFTQAGQNGAKEVSLPLQDIGQYYATAIVRRYQALVEYYNPLRYQRTGYTQLLTYSDDLSNAAWTKNATTATASATTDTEGLSNASKLAESATTAAHNATQTLTVSSGALSFGVLAQQAERKYLRLRLNNATDNDLASAVFDLNAGTVTAGSGTIKKLLNGWYWCRISGTATVANSKVFFDLSADGVTWNYAGAAGSGVYLFRATAIASAPVSNFPAIVSTAMTRAVTVPAVDPDDPLAFLVAESSPDSGTCEIGMAAWTRRYANVPAAVTRYSTVALTKPSASGVASATYSIVDFRTSDAGILTGNAYTYGGQWWTSLNTVFGTIASGSPTRTPASGGTFTLTYKSSTTAALNYNDSNATIAAAFNALADVVADGLVYTAANNLNAVGATLVLTATTGFTSSRITMNAASLTPAAAALAFTKIDSTFGQTITIATRVTLPSHGFQPNTDLMIGPVATQVKLYAYSRSWIVIDANTIAYNDAPSITQFAGYRRAYTPGATRIGTKIIQSFYLPGFTPGILTGNDIPVPTPLINDADFLTAVAANTSGFVDYDAQPKDLWMDPIYQQEVIQLNMGAV